MARSLNLKQADYERMIKEEVKVKRSKINEPGLEVQNISFDCKDLGSEETGVAMQTEECEYLFVTEPERPFAVINTSFCS